MLRRDFLATTAATLAASNALAANDRKFLYVAEPGIRNYVEYGGVGILVFDIDKGHKFVKRIPTWKEIAGTDPENVKGVEACAATAKIYVSTIKRMICIDLVTEKPVWDKEFEGGCDRMALSPDGKTLYIPSFEGPHWNVAEALTGRVIAKISPNSRAHNTIYSPDGKFAYLAGLGSPLLSIADTTTHKIARTVGPFSKAVRPFTVNGAQTLVYANVNELLGFEIGDMKTGKMIHRVEIKGVELGPVKRHGCPSHGIGLTPDEKEVWVADGHNSLMHVFDNTVMPPKPVTTLKLRDQPGWVTFSIDGKYAYPSSGEVFETKSKKLVTMLTDEANRQVGSEKMLEIDFNGVQPTKTGDQFGFGMKNVKK